MADFNRSGMGAVRALSQARGSDGEVGADILERATAILTQETSYLPSKGDGPELPAAAASIPQLRSLLGAPSGSSLGPDQLRQRAIDAVAALLASVDEAAGRSSTAFGFPWRQAAEAVNPGDDASVPLTVDNPEDRPVTLTFYSTDLVGDSGYQIPAHLISFDPPSQTVPPRSRATTRMNVAVPLQAIAGVYSALVQSVGLASTKAVVTLDIL